MEEEKEEIRGNNGEIVEKKENEKRKQHQRGGIRTLPFILGEPLH